MNPDELITSNGPGSSEHEHLFTVESANQALVLVRQVVEDIVLCYQRVTSLAERRDQLAGSNAAPKALQTIAAEMDSAAQRLKKLQGELEDVGCELKDWSQGLVDFPAMRAGKKILLCWKLGEASITHWHEVDSGFGGRKPIDAG